MRLIVSCLLLALLAAFPAPSAAQTPCDGAAPSAFFTLPPGSAGATFVFPYATADHDNGVASYTLRLKRQTGAVLSTQSVTKAATTVVGATSTSGVSCYTIPVVPVAQLPRGVPLVATLEAIGVSTELSSAEGPATAPFGAALPPPAIRPRSQ